MKFFVFYDDRGMRVRETNDFKRERERRREEIPFFFGVLYADDRREIL